jgi:Sec7-like guanine-nucleotide exchange factor
MDPNDEGVFTIDGEDFVDVNNPDSDDDGFAQEPEDEEISAADNDNDLASKVEVLEKTINHMRDKSSEPKDEVELMMEILARYKNKVNKLELQLKHAAKRNGELNKARMEAVATLNRMNMMAYNQNTTSTENGRHEKAKNSRLEMKAFADREWIGGDAASRHLQRCVTVVSGTKYTANTSLWQKFPSTPKSVSSHHGTLPPQCFLVPDVYVFAPHLGRLMVGIRKGPNKTSCPDENCNCNSFKSKGVRTDVKILYTASMPILMVDWSYACCRKEA